MESDQDLRRLLDARRRQHHTAPPVEAKPLGATLARWISDSGLARRYAMKDLYSAWQETVGKDASHCQIVGVKKGVVHVVVDSAACLHEMANFRKPEIIAGLRKTKGLEKIHNIEFRLGTLERQ
jgi:hypothetical protein